MEVVYDKERAAALIKAAQEITGHLKTETEGIKQQMARVLEGDEDDEATVIAEARPVKSRWRFWR